MTILAFQITYSLQFFPRVSECQFSLVLRLFSRSWSIVWRRQHPPDTHTLLQRCLPHTANSLKSRFSSLLMPHGFMLLISNARNINILLTSFDSNWINTSHTT